jgi:hypothetical protein
MLGALICSLAALTMVGAAGETEIVCISPEAAEMADMGHAAGWYNGDIDVAFVKDDLGFSYTRAVLFHELAHSWDLRKGTELNGYPSFFSETHTGFDAEEFARLQTYQLGEWPEAEAYPDEWAYRNPSDIGRDMKRMDRAGWLMEITT